jgi:hypothetical protein
MEMQWYHVMAVVLGNLAVILPLWLWNRTESNADRREASADRRDILNLIRGIDAEMKDFHGRLCAIEERNRGK